MAGALSRSGVGLSTGRRGIWGIRRIASSIVPRHGHLPPLPWRVRGERVTIRRVLAGRSWRHVSSLLHVAFVYTRNTTLAVNKRRRGMRPVTPRLRNPHQHPIAAPHRPTFRSLLPLHLREQGIAHLF